MQGETEARQKGGSNSGEHQNSEMNAKANRVTKPDAFVF